MSLISGYLPNAAWSQAVSSTSIVTTAPEKVKEKIVSPDSSSQAPSSLIENAVQGVQKAKKKKKKKKKSVPNNLQSPQSSNATLQTRESPSPTKKLNQIPFGSVLENFYKKDSCIDQVEAVQQPQPGDPNFNLNWAYYEMVTQVLSRDGHIIGAEIYRVQLSTLTEMQRKALFFDDRFEYCPMQANESVDAYFKRMTNECQSREDSKCRVYHVTSLKPVHIRNSSAMEFFKKYKKTIQDCLKEAIASLKVDTPSAEHNIDSSSSSSSVSYNSVVHSSRIATNPSQGKQLIQNLLYCAQAPQPDKAQAQLEGIDKAKAKLLDALLKVCQQGNFPPQEHMHDVWGLACYQILDSKSDAFGYPELKQQILELWANVHTHITLAFKTYTSSYDQKELALAQKDLQNFLSQMKGNTSIPASLRLQLSDLITPLIEWLKLGETLKDNYFNQYYGQSNSFWSLNLDQCSFCSVPQKASKTIFSNWIKLRSRYIFDFIKGLPLTPNSKQSLEEIAVQLKKALSKNNLFQVIHYSEKLEKLTYHLMRTENSEVKISHFRLLLRNQVNTLHAILEKSGDYKFINTKALKLFTLAAQELKKEPPIFPEKAFQPFKSWLKELRAASSFELYEAFEKLSRSWKEIKKIRQAVVDYESNAQLSNAFSGCYKEGLFHTFKDFYLLLSKQLDEHRESLMKLLEETNRSITKVQHFAFLMLTQENAPKIDLEVMRQQFMLLNQKISKLITPLFLYFNSSCQLIHLEDPSLPKANQLVLQSALEKDAKLYLFQTKSKYFKAFQSKLNCLAEKRKQAIAEAEESIVLEETSEEIQSSSDEDNIHEEIEIAAKPSPKRLSESDELSKKLDEAFRPTSRRHVVDNLKDLFKDYEVSYGFEWGNGGHEILLIRGVRIPIPNHKELAIGTAKNIRRALEDKLKLVAKK